MSTSLNIFSSSLTNETETAVDLKYRAVADWTSFRTILVGWPLRQQTWRKECKPAQKAILHFISQILQHTSTQHITVVIDASASGHMHNHLEQSLSSLDAEERLSVLSLPMDDCWVRDTGPIMMQQQNDNSLSNNTSLSLRAACFQFNAWGGADGGCYIDYDNDRMLATRISRHFQVPAVKHDFILEGGSVSSDGAGTLLTTEECLLCRNRNPTLSKADIEKRLCNALGGKKVIWLPLGAAHDYDTDGHVDNIAVFIRPATVLLLTAREDENREQYRRSEAAKKVLQAATTADGQKITIFEVLAPRPMTRRLIVGDGEEKEDKNRMNQRLCASYVNIVINGECVFAPAFGDQREDTRAYEQLSEAFEEDMKKIVMIPARELIWGGGGLHCLTLGVLMT